MLLNHVRIVAQLLLQHVVHHDAILQYIRITFDAHSSRLLVPLSHEVERVWLPEVKVAAEKHLRHSAQGRQMLGKRTRRCIVSTDERMLTFIPIPLVGKLGHILIQNVHVRRWHLWQRMSTRGTDGRKPRRACVDRRSLLPRVIQHGRYRI